MNILIHYETEDGPQLYTIVAVTKEEMTHQLEAFKKRTGLTDDQFTLQMVSA